MNIAVKQVNVAAEASAILEKLGARNRADAVSIILREGLVAI